MNQGRSLPPYRADHVGSLLRPRRLSEARADYSAGRISADDLREIEDECVAEAVAKQEQIGLNSVTDGEFRRESWHYDFLGSLEGIDVTGVHQGPAFQSGSTAKSICTTGVIRNPDGVMIDHFKYLNDVSSVTAKFCIPSPSLAHYRGGRDLIDDTLYPDLTQFWDDLCAAYRDEVSYLVKAGCRYLQFDDTTFAMLCDPKIRKYVADRGDDPVELVSTYARSIKGALSERPPELTVTVHMCRGNFKSSWVAEGGYEPVAEAMFAEVPVDGFFMEWDSDRAGGFEPLRFAPRDKIIVLGLVSSKYPELESKDDLKRQIDEAAKYVPIENLCLSPQCGFASMAIGNDISQASQWRKLELVVETAAEVWGEA